MRESSLQIRLLGPLEVQRDRVVLPLPPSRKARALLGYLVATGRAHGREHLCDLLWSGPADPRAALRGALSKLRPLVDDDPVARLVTEGDRVAFEPKGAGIDLILFHHVASNAGDNDIEALRLAASRFRGEFLEGLDLPRCYRFEAWCTAEREAALRQRVSILCALIERLADDPMEALRFARERLLLDPSAESAHIDVIRLLIEAGRQDAALEQYDTCRRILRTELGVQPSPALESMRRAIRPGRTPAQHPAHPVVPIAAARSSRPALVGRREEREVFRRLVGDASEGKGGAMLLLVGEAGMGKSRLLEEMGAMALEAGGEGLAGRAFEAEMVRPFGPWIDALRGIPTLEVPVGLRSELSPLLPELGVARDDSTDRNRLFEAVAGLLTARLQIHRPIVLLLDDLQWIDEASAALLHFALRAAPGHLLAACACRRAALDDNPAAFQLVNTLRCAGMVHQIDLAPLNAAETACLVRGVAPEMDGDRAFAESQGNPLFALEIARAGERDGGALPPTLEALIEGRLARLEAAARGLVPWAAALGRDFDIDTLARAAGMPVADLLLAVEEMERRGVLRPIGGRYDFVHDLVREVAYRRISEPRRRVLHGRIADVLAERSDANGEMAGEVARHASLAGRDEMAARACLTAAARALWTFAPGEAAALAARGIGHLDGLPAEIRLGLHAELLSFSVYPGMKEHRMPDLERELSRVIGEARAAGLKAQVYRGFQLISYIHFLNGDFDGALDRSLRAQDAGRAADPATVVRAIGDTARCLGIIDRDMPRAARLAREARSLGKAIDYEGQELSQAMGHVLHHTGRLDEAAEQFERAAHLARRDRERWFECICLSRLVMIELERECPMEALARCRELLTVTRQMEEGSSAPFAEALEALALMTIGDGAGVSSLDSALAGLRMADSRWMIAYVQNTAGGMDMDAGRCDAAGVRGNDALQAAELVDRRNEMAVARALLARHALQGGDGDRARAHLDAVHEDLERPGVLSCRARGALAAAANAVGGAGV